MCHEPRTGLKAAYGRRFWALRFRGLGVCGFRIFRVIEFGVCRLKASSLRIWGLELGGLEFRVQGVGVFTAIGSRAWGFRI